MLDVWVELLGTLVFFAVIQGKTSSPMAIAIALLAMIYLNNALGASAGHFNPGVTVMKVFSKSDRPAIG
jgi:hypothetical protein